MPTILNDVYSKVHSHSKQAYQNYWANIRYTGNLLDELCIIESTKRVKNDIIGKVKSSLAGTYALLDPLYVDTVILTTFCDGGLMLTPLEALELLTPLVNSLQDYKLLTTHISPVTIKERLRKVASIESGSNVLFTYLIDKSLQRLLPEVIQYGSDGSYTILDAAYSTSIQSYIDKLYRIFTFIAYQSVVKGHNRRLIYGTLRSLYYMYLRGGFPINTPLGSLIPLKAVCPRDEAVSYLPFFKREATINYYEPLIYSRIDDMSELLTYVENNGKHPMQDIHNIAFMEYADVYSKVVRTANIRRRLVTQDMRYIISEAVSYALRAIIKESTAPI